MHVRHKMGILAAVLATMFGTTPVLAAGDPINGRLVVEKWCSDCHASTGVELDQKRAPTFSQIINDWNLSRSDLKRFMQEDHFPMTTYRLFDHEKRDVIEYLLTHRKN